MFYLLVLYVAPYEAHRDLFFMNLQRYGVLKNKPKHDRGSLRWFKVRFKNPEFPPQTLSRADSAPR